MIGDMFAGMPSEHIKNVILERHKWDVLVGKLERF